MTHLLRKTGQAILVLVAVSMISFLLMALVPGSFYDEARSDPRVSPATVDAMRERSGVDAPLVQRYGRWLRSMMRGEGGYSIVYQMAAAPLIAPRAAKTTQLALLALAITWLCSLGIGVWGAVRPSKAITALSDWITATLAAVPELVLACLVLMLVVRSGVGRIDQIWTPALVLGLSGIPAVLPHVRIGMQEVATAPYLLLARTQGVRGMRFVLIFWLRAALNPLLSLFGLSVGTMLSSSLAVEIICGWPGMGQLFVSSIEARDPHVVVGVVMLSTVLLLAGNLVTDLLLAALDPRIRRPE